MGSAWWRSAPRSGASGSADAGAGASPGGERRSVAGPGIGTEGVAGAVAAVVVAGAALVALGGHPLIGGSVAALGGAAAGTAAALAARRASRLGAAAAAAEGARRDIEGRLGRVSDDLAASEHRAGAGESIHDAESGLLDHRVFTVTFERKIAAARRHLRPLSVILIDLGAGLAADPGSRNEALARWGAVATATLRESDIAFRVADTTFAVILEDTAEAGAVWVAERLQIAAACSGGGLLGPLSAAVASYPTHGLRAEEVLRRAWVALGRSLRYPVEGDRFGRVELPAPER